MPENISEIFPLYDTVIVSQRFHGGEAGVKGWFGGSTANPTIKPFHEFSRKERHVFFKDRTEATASLAYCNNQSAETMDYAMRIYGVGVRFWGPVSAFEVAPTYEDPDTPPPWGTIDRDDPVMVNSCLSAWWKGSAPSQCAFELKVEQDVICEGPCATFPPGHGFVGSGVAWGGTVTPEILDDPQASGEALILQHPQMISVMNQGVPRLSNRFIFRNARGEPDPIQIPRGSLLEATVTLSPYVQYMLENVAGPLFYLFNRRCPRKWIEGDPEGEVTMYSPAYWFGTRYGITVSLIGERLVQPRGQYWAPGRAAAAAE
jgi:hypothetical protein